MAKRGGFPGGMPGNMNNLMKQAQRMQRQMEEKQQELETKEFTATAGGGAVAAVWMLRRCFGWQGITPLHTIGTVLTVACLYGTAVLLSMRRKTAIPPRGGEKIFPHK